MVPPHQDQVLGWTEESLLARLGEAESRWSTFGPISQFDCCRWFLRHLKVGCNRIHRLRAPAGRSIAPNMDANCGSGMAIR
jgi:hypothetical protein